MTERHSRNALASRSRRPGTRGGRSNLRRYGALLLVGLLGGLAAGCSGDSSDAIENPIRRLKGRDLPPTLIDSYTDSGQLHIGWHFLPADDPFCRETVRTEQTCLRITTPERTVSYGAVVVAGGRMLVDLTYDELGKCVKKWRFAYTVEGERLDLHRGVCGAPVGPLTRGAPPG